jgi:hypothetical protein
MQSQYSLEVLAISPYNTGKLFNKNQSRSNAAMGKPKKQTTGRRTRNRRSHMVGKLAKRVNALSPVKVFTKKRQHAKAAAKAASK